MQTQSELLSLVTRTDEGSTLVARVEDLEFEIAADDVMHVIDAVRQLLRSKRVLITHEKGDL